MQVLEIKQISRILLFKGKAKNSGFKQVFSGKIVGLFAEAKSPTK
jgi:acyl-CoA thioesterase